MESDRTPSFAAPPAGFRSRKAAQMCVFFALKSGGSIEKLKLIKLIYLSERLFLNENDHPMLWDEFYSLPHGPICSSTLHGIDGHIDRDVWSDYIVLDGNFVAPARRYETDDLDEFSRRELRTIERIWSEFGSRTASQLRNYTHDSCPEYTEVQSGRIPISYKDVWSALGSDHPAELEAELMALRRAESTLTR